MRASFFVMSNSLIKKHQLLDEMAVIANAAPLPSSTNQAFPFKSSLLYASNNVFEAHLRQRSKEIRDATSLLFSKFPTPPPDVREMQERLAALLAAEKVHVAEMQRVESEKEQLSDRLENASYRYMVAEKKFDRSKSAQVAKIEAQASATSRPDIAESGSPAVKKEESKPGQLAEDGIVDQEVEIARKELAALAEKRAHQLEALEAENKKLTEDLNNTRLRLSGLTDDDYASSDLFKVIKSQHEDVVKRVNDLETLNIQLRAEAKQLQVERTAYREEADNELRAATIEMESQLARSEADLARIRHARDELVADIGVRKASHDQNKASYAQIQELAGAREARIESLEIELDRLRTAVATVAAEDGTAEEEMDPSTARTRLAAVEKDKRLLENELRSMETAFKKASMAASKKIADMTEAEERMVRLAADKAKAEQKFFAAMKAKETREVEARTLRVQNTKSTEIVSQLKEAESSCRALLVNLEKQLAEARDAITVVTSGSRAAQQTLGEQKLSSDRLTTQVEEVKKMLIEKDAAAALAMNAQRKFESTASELQVRLDESQKSLESMRKKGIGHQSEEYEMLRVCSSPPPLSIEVSAKPVTFSARRLRYAQCAARTSRIRRSRRAATSSARSASTSASLPARASVRIAARRLAMAITCASRCERERGSSGHVLRIRRTLYSARV